MMKFKLATENFPKEFVKGMKFYKDTHTNKAYFTTKEYPDKYIPYESMLNDLFVDDYALFIDNFSIDNIESFFVEITENEANLLNVIYINNQIINTNKSISSDISQNKIIECEQNIKQALYQLNESYVSKCRNKHAK